MRKMSTLCKWTIPSNCSVPLDNRALSSRGIVLVPAIRGARFNPPMRGPEDLANWAETIKRYAAV